jgi:hypothetical protein
MTEQMTEQEQIYRCPHGGCEQPVNRAGGETYEEHLKRCHPPCPLCGEQMYGEWEGKPACISLGCHEIHRNKMKRLGKQTCLEVRKAKPKGGQRFL